jgi:hypothetical protein
MIENTPGLNAELYKRPRPVAWFILCICAHGTRPINLTGRVHVQKDRSPPILGAPSSLHGQQVDSSFPFFVSINSLNRERL